MRVYCDSGILLKNTANMNIGIDVELTNDSVDYPLLAYNNICTAYGPHKLAVMRLDVYSFI
jgi:hypothetical protein